MVAGVDLNYQPLGYESRGELQIQLLCGADDNLRGCINTGDYEDRDLCLTLFWNREG
jgi:hypothetical protein